MRQTKLTLTCRDGVGCAVLQMAYAWETALSKRNFQVVYNGRSRCFTDLSTSQIGDARTIAGEPLGIVPQRYPEIPMNSFKFLIQCHLRQSIPKTLCDWVTFHPDAKDNGGGPDTTLMQLIIDQRQKLMSNNSSQWLSWRDKNNFVQISSSMCDI